MFAWQATVQDEAGNAVPLPVVTVWNEDGVTLADIYDEGGDPIPNPLTGTMDGFVQFWASAGQYKIEGAHGGSNTEVWSVTIDAPAIRAEAWAESPTPPDPLDPDSKSAKTWAEIASDYADAFAPYESRAIAEAAVVPSPVIRIAVRQGGMTLTYLSDPDGTALETADGRTWSPDGQATLEHFGAVGDGITDDTSAIQDAFNAAPKFPLLLMEKVYRTQGNLTAPTNSCIRGTSWRSVIRLLDGATCSHVVKLGNASAVSYAVFENLEIDGNKAGGAIVSDAGFIFERPYKFFSNRLRVINCSSDGILLGVSGSCLENYLRDPSSYANNGVGIRMLGQITDTHILGGDIGYNADAGVILATSCSLRGVTIWGGGQPASRGVVTAGVNLRIVDCNVEGHGTHGIVVSNGNTSVDIQNCRIYANSFTDDNSGLYDGINIGTGTSGNILGNVFRSAASSSSDYSMRHAIHFNGAHSEWSILGNDMSRMTAGSPPTFSDGEIVYGVLNTDICDFKWIRTSVLASQLSNVNLPNGAWADIPFSEVVTDRRSEYSGGVFTPKSSGRYLISVSCTIDPSSDEGQFGVRIYSGVTEMRRLAFVRASGGSSQMVRGEASLFLTAGTAYNIQVFAQSSADQIVGGASINILTIRPDD